MGNYEDLQDGLNVDVSQYDLEEYTLQELREQRGFLVEGDISLDNGLSPQEEREALASYYVSE